MCKALHVSMVALLAAPHRCAAAGSPCASPTRSALKGSAKKAYPPGNNRSAYQSDTIFVSHKYRFIYVKTAKTGGTSVVSFLTATLCSYKYRGWSAFAHDKPCPHVLTQAGPNKESRWPTEREWMDYFVFAFVRDPLARRESMHNYCRIGRWCESCAAPSTRCGVCTPVHCRPQYVQLFHGNLPVVDFVGRTERLGDDLATALAIVNSCLPDSSMRIQKLTGVGHANAQPRRRGRRPPHDMNQSQSCPRCYRQVQMMYREDYRRFAFDS